jgi:hypothetical protein
MFSRELTPKQKAERAAQLAATTARWNAAQVPDAQRLAEKQTRDADNVAFLERKKATDERLARGESVVDQVTTHTSFYADKAVEEEAARLVARKAVRDAAKLELENGAANTDAHILAGLPPGDPLRKAAALRVINPEDFE